MGDNRRSGSNVGSGSYLVMQQMKDTYHHLGKLGSPNTRHQARFASPTGQHLLSEIQRLQASNAKLNAKLAFAANRVPGLNRMLGMKDSLDGGLLTGVSGTLSKREDSATMAAGRAPRSSAETGSGPGAELLIDDLLLSPEEVQEAAMRCCWLARYWTLAEQLGICDDIAHEKASYWRSLALPMSAYFECARSASAPYVVFKPGARTKEVSSRASETAIQPYVPGITGEPYSGEPGSLPAYSSTIADTIEIERGLRQLAELGVVQEVAASLMHQRQAAYSAQLQAGIDSYDPDEAAAAPRSSATAASDSLQQHLSTSFAAAAPDAAVPGSSGAEEEGSSEVCASEAQEIAFQRGWLAYIWARAAVLGVEPHICRDRAEHWGHQLWWSSGTGTPGPSPQQAPTSSPASPFASGQSQNASPRPAWASQPQPQQQQQQQQQQQGVGGNNAIMALQAKELAEVRAGMLELARLGIDQQIWVCRLQNKGQQ